MSIEQSGHWRRRNAIRRGEIRFRRTRQKDTSVAYAAEAWGPGLPYFLLSLYFFRWIDPQDLLSFARNRAAAAGGFRNLEAGQSNGAILIPFERLERGSP